MEPNAFNLIESLPHQNSNAPLQLDISDISVMKTQVLNHFLCDHKNHEIYQLNFNHHLMCKIKVLPDTAKDTKNHRSDSVHQRFCPRWTC